MSREELVKELQRVEEKVERPPRQEDMCQFGAYSRGPYESEFESWAAALREAGITPGPRQSQNQNIPEQDLIEELRRVAKKLGKPPSSREMERLGEYSTTPYKNRFGSWNEAIEEAGLAPEHLPPGER